MKNMTLKNIASACKGIYHGSVQQEEVEVTSITTDSRKIQEDCLFIAIRGARSDGHDYIESAMKQGAACVISEKELEDTTYPYIKVESSLEAIKEIALFYRSQLSVKVIGITGSVGKTSTKETVASVLSEKYRVLKTLGNFNNELGLPLTIFRLREEDEVAVLEMGISDFGEMHRLSRIAKPDICIMTNIGICHLENLKTRDGILKAKSEIFDFMNPNGQIIVNGDDDKLITVRDVNGVKPLHFGMDSSFDVWADNVYSVGLKGTKCTIHTIKGSFEVLIPIPGKHMVHNAMAATLAGIILGLDTAQIQAGIEKLEALSGRNNILFGKKYTLIDDCYNANPVSMRASIDVLCDADTRKVAILGDMGELGQDEKKLHYELGEYVGKSAVDILLCVGELSKEMEAGFLTVRRPQSSQEQTVFHYDTVEGLLADVNNRLLLGDSVLVKASHFMKFEQIVKALQDGETN